MPLHRKPTMLSQTQNQNSWASGPRGALPSTCVTLFILLTQTQAACLFRPERWKRFLLSLCSSRNNNSQGDFDSGYQETTSQTTSRYSSVSFSPVSCFFFHLCFVCCSHCFACTLLTDRSTTGRTYWGKPWARGSWSRPGKAQPGGSFFLGHNRVRECQRRSR